MRPRLLDLFCGAGGAAMGYHRAGLDVVGVDIAPQPNYPFEFIQGNALDPPVGDWGWIDAIHASPPCRFATDYQRTGNVGEHENLIPATRELLEATGLPYVIENVEKARSWLFDPAMLCGSMFDPPLDVRRHRLFETNWPLLTPAWPCRHKLWSARYPAATNRAEGSRRTVEIGVWRIPLDVQKRAMGVEWGVTLEELSEAIPPTYTKFIGAQLLAHLRATSLWEVA